MNREQRTSELLEKVDSWDEFDVFELDILTNGHPLEVLFMYLLDRFELFTTLGLDTEKCRAYCREIESRYNETNPYHNKVHAADVLQAVAVIVLSTQWDELLSPIEILSILLSATIHDIEHPGVTNGYHVNKQTELAIRYNDRSVNENMHVSLAYEILLKDADHMLSVLTKSDYDTLRKLVINTVLATDMAGHNALVERFAETFPLQDGFSLSNCSFDERDLLIQMIVHCADISNPVRPWKYSRTWSYRITEEMHLQGDRECSEGRKPERPFDRKQSCMKGDQLAFLNIIVCPCFACFAAVAPAFVKSVLCFAEENKTNWRNEFQPDEEVGISIGTDIDVSTSSS
eukprot:g9260.t1